MATPVHCGILLSFLSFPSAVIDTFSTSLEFSDLMSLIFLDFSLPMPNCGVPFSSPSNKIHALQTVLLEMYPHLRQFCSCVFRLCFTTWETLRF